MSCIADARRKSPANTDAWATIARQAAMLTTFIRAGMLPRTPKMDGKGSGAGQSGFELRASCQGHGSVCSEDMALQSVHIIRPSRVCGVCGTKREHCVYTGVAALSHARKPNVSIGAENRFALVNTRVRRKGVAQSIARISDIDKAADRSAPI